jgi:hypothetical protein
MEDEMKSEGFETGFTHRQLPVLTPLDLPHG